MKKALFALTLFVFLFSGLGFLLSQQNGEDAKFAKTLDSYLDEMWKFYPTAATLAGFYKYNDKLEDLSAKNIDKRHDALDSFNQQFVAKIDRTKLSPEMLIDFEMVTDALHLEYLKHENLLPWDYNPIFYNEIFLFSLKSLLGKEFAPPDARMKSAVERAKALPGLIKQAKENLKTPPQVFTETAIKQFPGVLDFYKNDVPKLIEAASADLKTKFQAEMAKIIPALEDYQGFLQSTLLPKSTGNFRLGEAHRRLLQNTLQNTLTIEELGARAKADTSNIRREMAMASMPLYRIMYPHINMEQISTQYTEEQLRSLFIKGVLDKIKAEHVTKDNFLAQVKTTADRVKAFLTEKQLVELPEENLAVEPMPLVLRGLTWTRLQGPGAYEAAGNYTCLVSPIPDDLGAEQVQSLLEEYNSYFINFWVVRKVYPGSFVPEVFTRKNASLIRKLYPNLPLLKGWSASLDEMLITSGFGNYDLRLRLYQLKQQLQAVIDFQLEVNIHQTDFTKEQAVDLMTKVGFQTPAEAERKWNRICLKPGESAYAYIGYQEILDIEKDYKKLKGNGFSQKEFLQKLLSYGAIPIRHLKTRMAQ